MNFEYSLSNAVNWGNFSYHYDKAKQGSSHVTLHAALAALEFLPIVSQVVSLIELGIVSLIDIMHKKDTSNLENDKIAFIAKNKLEINREESVGEKNTKKQPETSSDVLVSKDLSTHFVEISAFSEKEQTKIITAAENLASNLASNFHRKLLAHILSNQQQISSARKENLSHLSEEEIHQRNELINEVETRTEHLSSRNQNLNSLIKIYFKNYFTIEILKQLQYKNNIIYFTISDYHPQKWLSDILDACGELQNADKKSKEIFRKFFFAKHEFRLSRSLDSYEEIIDGKSYKSKIF